MDQEVCIKLVIKDDFPCVGSTVANWKTLTSIQKKQMIKEAIVENVYYIVTNEHGDQITE